MAVNDLASLVGGEKTVLTLQEAFLTLLSELGTTVAYFWHGCCQAAEAA